MSAKVSVIVPACNEERYIRSTLNSYRSQSVPHELIVVANGCNDNTPDIASDLGVRVVELKHPSIPAAKNEGALRSEGDILVFNDADTIASPNYLECILTSLTRGDADYGAARAKAENWSVGALAYAAMLNFGAFVLRESCGNMFVGRESFDDISGFDESFSQGEDTDLSVRLREHGNRFTFLLGTYTIPSARSVSLQRTLRDSLSYVQFLLQRRK